MRLDNKSESSNVEHRRGPELALTAVTAAGGKGILLAALLMAGCGKNLDAAMWDCQLEVQKGNAGQSAEAAAERARDIEACMRANGYVLDVARPACRESSVNSTCYKSQ